MGARSRPRHRRRDLLGAGFASTPQEIPGQLCSGGEQMGDYQDLVSLLADSRLTDRVPIERVPAIISQLAAMIVRLAAKQMQAQCEPCAGPSASDPRRPLRREWLTIEEAHSQYPLSKSWLYRNAMKLGFAKKMGAKVVISVQLFERYLAEGRNR